MRGTLRAGLDEQLFVIMLSCSESLGIVDSTLTAHIGSLESYWYLDPNPEILIELGFGYWYPAGVESSDLGIEVWRWQVEEIREDFMEEEEDLHRIIWDLGSRCGGEKPGLCSQKSSFKSQPHPLTSHV